MNKNWKYYFLTKFIVLVSHWQKWRAYRIKIINLQRLWRGRLSITAAQSLLIDLQWQREQESRTHRLVERLFEEGAEKATIENERIDNINRTRKLIKLKSLPKIRNDTRHEIRERLMKGTDLLSADHICPTIFRAEIIGEFLRYLRRFHLDRVKQYNQAKMRYGKIIKEAQLRRAVLIRFSGNQSSGRSVFDTEQEPVRPYVRVILRKRCLDILLSIGADYVESVRHAWMPKTMKINPFCFDGVKEAALVQINDTCRVESDMV